MVNESFQISTPLTNLKWLFLHPWHILLEGSFQISFPSLSTREIFSTKEIYQVKCITHFTIFSDALEKLFALNYLFQLKSSSIPTVVLKYSYFFLFFVEEKRLSGLKLVNLFPFFQSVDFFLTTTPGYLPLCADFKGCKSKVPYWY